MYTQSIAYPFPWIYKTNLCHMPQVLCSDPYRKSLEITKSNLHQIISSRIFEKSSRIITVGIILIWCMQKSVVFVLYFESFICVVVHICSLYSFTTLTLSFLWFFHFCTCRCRTWNMITQHLRSWLHSLCRWLYPFLWLLLFWFWFRPIFKIQFLTKIFNCLFISFWFNLTFYR